MDTNTEGIVGCVDPDSAADRAGIVKGCRISAVDGHALRDIIDWRWWADGQECVVDCIFPDGSAEQIELEREFGQDWGISFESALFDDIKPCRNACTFCFMRQLPKDMRPSLYLPDDDYRLSFLQGNFVTLTNATQDDLDHIVDMHISPLRFSLHAVTPEVRQDLMGRHAPHGIACAEQLLESGIELHAQIVLLPGVNDADELKRTIEWAYERPGILTVGIVPLGFTKYQTEFTSSFEDPADAKAVIDLIAPYQQQAQRERGFAWVFASDEFYRNAFGNTLLNNLPPTEFYGDFSMFEDGIGIVRSSVDDWNECAKDQKVVARELESKGMKVAFACGCAQKEFTLPLFEHSPFSNKTIEPIFIPNDFFGGNVDVTGLLCGCDVAHYLSEANKQAQAQGRGYDFAVIQDVVLNEDDLFLDGLRIEDVTKLSGLQVHVVSCQASEYLPQIARIISQG